MIVSHKTISNRINLLYLLILLAALTPPDGYTYLNCPLYKEILSCEDINSFEKDKIPLWQKSNNFTKHCNVYIGKKYHEFFQRFQKKKYLNNAINYLSFISKHIRKNKDEPEFTICFEYLIRCEISKESPDFDTIIAYQFKIPEKNLLNEKDIFRHIRKPLEERFDGYLKNPIYTPYPHKLMDCIKRSEILTNQINRIQSVHQKVTTFKSELASLQTNQSLKQIERVLVPLKSLPYEPDDRTISAIKNFSVYHTTIKNNENTSNENECNTYQLALNYLNEAQEVLPYLTDTLKADGLKKFACLSKEIQNEFDLLMPDPKFRNNFKERSKRCYSLLEQYTEQSIKSYSRVDKTLITKLKYLNDFYNAYNSLVSPDSSVVYPTNALQKLMRKIAKSHMNIPYLKALSNYAGFYIAEFYYQQALELLLSGIGEDRNTTLSNIRQLLDKFNKYKQYFTKIKIDINKEYHLLRKFFDDYEKNKKYDFYIGHSQHQMNANIKKAWNIKE